ncbi:MAG: hypothetical protein WAL63_08530 [Solirubrobacteraceae bacterium]
MRPPTSDLTAGERARSVRADPGAPQRINDSTDPRYGELLLDPLEAASDAPPIIDPTDPECGRRRDRAQ